MRFREYVRQNGGLPEVKSCNFDAQPRNLFQQISLFQSVSKTYKPLTRKTIIKKNHDYTPGIQIKSLYLEVILNTGTMTKPMVIVASGMYRGKGVMFPGRYTDISDMHFKNVTTPFDGFFCKIYLYTLFWGVYR
ncbi:MAG: hypothetical protein Kow00127_20560 [Bacteroidales bacterium]